MRKKHISRIIDGEKLRLNLNDVTRHQFDMDIYPENLIDVTCVVKPDGSKVFVDDEGREFRPKEFLYDYKGYFYKNETDIILWIYNDEPIC